MPVFTIDQIRAKIESNEIAAVSLDTSIFDQFGCNLQYKTLASVENFRKSGLQFIISEITIEEVTNHILADIKAASDKASAAINQFRKARRIDLDLEKIQADLGISDDPIVEAQ